jgi:anaerobic magnesium-protoporphyrin IX monomethyl ester cyclase
MRLAFIYPKFGYVENQPNIKEVADSYGVFPPLTLLYVASIAKSSGHECILIDGNALNLKKEQILKKIKDFKPDLLFFTITTYMFHDTISWIKYLKKKTSLPVAVGGLHLSHFPEETMTYKDIDYGFLGEVDKSLPLFLENIKKNKELKDVPGLIFRKNNKIIKTENPKPTLDVDSLPFPDRSMIPNEKYFSFISKKKNYTGIITSFGCPYSCIFCEQHKPIYRHRSAKNVADEIEECIKKYGVKEIEVFDPVFTLNKERVIKLCKEIIKRKLKIALVVRTRPDLVDKELLKWMARAGVKRIYYGIESGSEKILKNIKKDTNKKVIRKAIKETKQAGITAFGYFMIGCPGETEETIKETVNFAKSLDLDYAQFSKLSTLPGTELYELLKKELKRDYWREYILDKSKALTLPRYKCKLSEEEIQNWVKKAYKAFYFRPSQIIKILKNTKSIFELKRYIEAGVSMIFSKNN